MTRRYVAELQRLQRDAAANYLLLKRLWRSPAEGQVCYGLRHAGRDIAQVSLQRLEESRWTEWLELQVEVIQQHPLVQPVRMQLRSYHDVRMTEVISCQEHCAREGRYKYPNPGMFHPDEKVQVNQFFGELMRFTLDKGYSLELEVNSG